MAQYIGPEITTDYTLAELCGTPTFRLEVYLDWEERTIDIWDRPESDRSWTAREHHGHAWAHTLPLLTRADALALIELLMVAVDEIAETYSSEWDGSNHVARWACGHDEHEERLYRLEQMIHDSPVNPCGGLWDAADWADPAPPTVSASTTDAELEALAAELQDEAHHEGIHLHGVDEYLEGLRSEATTE